MINRLIFSKPRRRRELPLGPYSGFCTGSLVLVRSDGVALQGWTSKSKLPLRPRKVLIYFGGRMEDTFWAPKMASYLKGWTVYSFNYRGFGESKGYASEMNAKGDALAIYEFVKSMHPEVETEFALMGRSLGTSFALWLAQKVNPTSLILVSPFCSLRSVIRGKLWLAPFSVLAHKRFCNSDLAPSIAARTLFILAEQDRAIAHHDSLHLAKVFGVPPIVAIIDGTDHRTVPRSRGAQRAIANFLTGIALSEC